MNEIIKSSVNEVFKKPLKIFIIFILNLFIVFGINQTMITPEVFTFFLPLTFIIIFMEKDGGRGKNLKNIFVSFLIYSVIFILTNVLLYKYVEFLEQKDFVSNGDIILYKTVYLISDILNCAFIMSIFYSMTEKAEKDKNKIAVFGMFKYFSQKSSNIIIIFYGVILGLFSTVLILYGADNSLCHNIINLVFLLFSVIFLIFLMTLFKNFVLWEKTDEIIVKIKNLKYCKKEILKGAGVIIISFIAVILFFILSAQRRNIFLLTLGGISLGFLVTAVEIIFLNIFISINGKKQDKIFTVKKFFNTLGVNILGTVTAGVIFLVFYIIEMNFFIWNTLAFYTVPAVIFNFLGIILSFQFLGIFTEKPFGKALKEGFALSSKFMNLKVLIILFGADIITTINILNGMFQGVFWALNIVVSLYMINFYLEEEMKMCQFCQNIQLWKKFDSPKNYLECIEYISQLVESGNFEFIEEKSTCPLNQIKTEKGWADEIMVHVIRCKYCGKIFACVVNTYRGSGSFKKSK